MLKRALLLAAGLGLFSGLAGCSLLTDSHFREVQQDNDFGLSVGMDRHEAHDLIVGNRVWRFSGSYCPDLMSRTWNSAGNPPCKDGLEVDFFHTDANPGDHIALLVKDGKVTRIRRWNRYQIITGL
jgi:hypothetical protein